MKYIAFFLLVVIILFSLFSCKKNILETDKELSNDPFIDSIYVDTDYGFIIRLDRAYSDEAELCFERKDIGAFDPIKLKIITPSTYADTTIDLELNAVYTYRVRVKKDEHYSLYSNEKNYNYVSNILNKPSNLHCTVEELSGIRLYWQDNSTKETGYKIEKNSGLGFEQIADLPENSETYFDEITTIPTEPITIQYRIKAYNDNLESPWLETTANYSGIAAPTNLTVTDTTSYHFTITWQDNSSIETGYSVERKKDNGNYSQISLLPPNSIIFTDNLTELGEYFYRVRAKKDNLYSDYTNVVSHQVNIIIPTEGLVAYYPFNGNANDESGNGNNGTVHGATLTTDRFGNANKAYSFDGSNDYINCLYPNMLPIGNEPFSVSIWFKLSSLSSSRRDPWSWGNASHTHYNACDITSDKITFYNYSNDPDFVYENFNTGQWYHYIVSYDGSTLYQYLGSELRISNSNLSAFNVSPGTEISIGRDWGRNTAYFYGSVDDIRIYNRALSEEEIQALYHEGGWGK